MKHVLETERLNGDEVILTVQQIDSDIIGLDLLTRDKYDLSEFCIQISLNKRELFDLIGSLHHFQKQMK